MIVFIVNEHKNIYIAGLNRQAGYATADDENDETRYQIRGQDYAIDICGVLDVLKPVVTLMIKRQSLSAAPWKIVSSFLWLLLVFKTIETELLRFQGLHVVEMWIVTGQKDATSVQDAGAKKKNVTYEWNAREPSDCLYDLITLSKEMNVIMQRRYEEIVLPGVAKLAQIFYQELLVSVMSSFCIENSKFTISPYEKRSGTRLVLLNFPSSTRSFASCHK